MYPFIGAGARPIAMLSHNLSHVLLFVRIFMIILIILKVNRVRMNIPSPCLAGELRGVDGNIHKAVVSVLCATGFAGSSPRPPCARTDPLQQNHESRVFSHSRGSMAPRCTEPNLNTAARSCVRLS